MSNRGFIIIHGPQGCGKTTHAAALASHFGCHTIVDEEDWVGGSPAGVLILTQDDPGPLANARVMSFEEACRQAGLAAAPLTPFWVSREAVEEFSDSLPAWDGSPAVEALLGDAYPSPGALPEEVIDPATLPVMKEPTLKDRLGSAIFIVSFGAKDAGLMTRRKLMYPHTEYEVDDLKRVASRLLASVHTELLATLPPLATERISKDLDAYLSFALGDGWPDENSPSPASE